MDTTNETLANRHGGRVFFDVSPQAADLAERYAEPCGLGSVRRHGQKLGKGVGISYKLLNYILTICDALKSSPSRTQSVYDRGTIERRGGAERVRGKAFFGSRRDRDPSRNFRKGTGWRLTILEGCKPRPQRAAPPSFKPVLLARACPQSTANSTATAAAIDRLPSRQPPLAHRRRPPSAGPLRAAALCARWDRLRVDTGCELRSPVGRSWTQPRGHSRCRRTPSRISAASARSSCRPRCA